MTHSERLYHCVDCRTVYYFERTERKIMETCEHCGPTTMFRIDEVH